MSLVFDAVKIDTPSGDALLQIPEAEIGTGLTALTGVNGAGKSTLLRTIFDLHPLKEGAIRFGELDSRKDRRVFLGVASFQFQNFTAYSTLDAKGFLVHSARLRGARKSEAMEQAVQWIEAVGLDTAGRQKIRAFSQGMLQRLGVAYALQCGPKLCVLDEPFAGVDPAGRSTLGALLQAASEDRVVLVSTHYTKDLQALGARTAHIENGSLALLDPVRH